MQLRETSISWRSAPLYQQRIQIFGLSTLRRMAQVLLPQHRGYCSPKDSALKVPGSEPSRCTVFNQVRPMRFFALSATNTSTAARHFAHSYRSAKPTYARLGCLFALRLRQTLRPGIALVCFGQQSWRCLLPSKFSCDPGFGDSRNYDMVTWYGLGLCR